MTQARAAADGETLARVSHGLRSAAAAMGLVKLCQMTIDLEAQSRAGDFLAAGALIGLIKEELAAVVPILDRQRRLPPLAAARERSDQT